VERCLRQVYRVGEEADCDVERLVEEGLAVRVLDRVYVKLLAFQHPAVIELAKHHLEAVRRMYVLSGRLFDWDEEAFREVAERLECEGFFVTLDYKCAKYGSPMGGGYLYVYDMNRPDELRRLWEELGVELRVLPGKPSKDNELEQLFFDCLARSLAYDVHAVALWLQNEELRKYTLLAPPNLVEQVCEARTALVQIPSRPLDSIGEAIRFLVNLFGVDRLIFIGAIAVYAWLGYRHRETEEIDVIFLGDEEELNNALDYRNFYVLYERGRRRYYVLGRRVDFHTRGRPIGGVPVENIVARSTYRSVFGTTVRVPSLDDLIAMKLASGRPTDLEDVEALRRKFRLVS